MQYESYDIFNAAKLACQQCEVGRAYGRVVGSDGDAVHPAVMVIGEAPGREEVAAGKPFVGKSGRLLRDTLNRYGYRKDNAIITNVMPCRPPDNRFPEDDEVVKACVKKWLWNEIDVLKPKHILLVGKALKFVLGVDGITRQRGLWRSLVGFGSLPITCLPTFHPSYVLRMEFMDEGFFTAEPLRTNPPSACGFCNPLAGYGQSLTE